MWNYKNINEILDKYNWKKYKLYLMNNKLKDKNMIEKINWCSIKSYLEIIEKNK